MSIGPAGSVTAAQQAGINGGDEQLKKAARQLESVFYYYMVKAMRDTVPKDDLFGGGEGEDVMTSMLDQGLSDVMAAGNGDSAFTARMLDQLRGRSAYIGAGQSAPGMTPDAGALSQTAPAPASVAAKDFGAPSPKAPAPVHAQAADFGGLAPRSPAHAQAPVPVRPSAKAESEPESIGLKLLGRITSHFGPRKDPFTGEIRQHNGLDIAAPEGSPVRSAGDGKVVFSGERKGYGNLVIVDHGGGLLTYYGHCSKTLVKEGETVKKDEEIAKVGHTGRATGPHLHFEVRMDGRAVNPQSFVAG